MLSIRQKIPLRSYIGLQSTTDGEIRFEPHQVFIPSDRQFRYETRRVPQQHEITAFVQQLLVTRGRTGGWRIHVLHELPIGAGIGSYAPTASALAVAIQLITGGVTVDDIAGWQRHPWHLFDAGRRRIFDQAFRLAWRLESMYKGDMAAGCADFTALLSSPWPIVFSSQPRSDDPVSTAGRIFNDRGDLFASSETMEYWGGRLPELFGLRKTETWPIDFGLFYSGNSMNEEMAVRSSLDIQHDLRAISLSARQAVEKSVPTMLQAKLQFVTQLQEASGDGLWEAYLAALNATTIEGIVAFRHIFDRSSTSQAISELFRAIDEFEGFSRLFDKASLTTTKLEQLLRQVALVEASSITTKVLGAGRGGDLLFATPMYTFEDNIESVCQQLRRHVGKRVWLDYASWIDGMEDRGVVIEQNLAAKKYSSFITPGAVVVRAWERSASATQVFNPQQFERSRRTFDLLLDPSENALFIRGQAVTSKHLHSRKATMGVLRILLQQLGKPVPASHLPASSYRDRTTMQGKIVGPLCEAFAGMTKKQLPLNISGGLNSNFTLRLDASDLTIGLVEKRL